MLTYVSTTIAALGGAMVVAPAQAEAPARHCVKNVSAAGAPASCYDSFTKAIARATGGRVTDAPSDVRRAMNDPRFTARLDITPATDFILSIEWEDSDFEGDTLTFTADRGCTGTLIDIDFADPGVPVDEDWNDEIGSYRGFSNCFVQHFEHVNFGGRSIGFDGGRADMGFMDDEASSFRWS